MRAFAVSVIVLSAMLCAAQADAQQGGVRPANPLDPSVVFKGVGQMADVIARGVFQQADTNRDGMLTRAEAMAAGAQYGLPIGSDPRAWAALDLNHDGVVVQREMADAIRAVHARTAQGLKPF